MPTYDGVCPICGRNYQYLLKSYSEKDPKCKHCDVIINRKIPAPAIIGVNFEPHFAYRKNDDGTSEKIMISTRAEQKEFCRHQKLYDPNELPNNINFGEDGRVASSGVGESGQWI